MLRLMSVICIWLFTLPAFSQSASSKYQVGTITAVKLHASAGDGRGDVSYDVSVKVGDTVYVVLYTPPLGASPVKYAAGRNLLVLVGEKTLRYNDIIGQSLEVPIVSRKSTDARQSK